MHVALFGDLFETGVAILQLLFFRAQLVVVRNLEQHPRIRAGNTGKAEEADGRAYYEYIEILDGNGDLAELAVVAASHKKNVEALMQMPSLIKLLIDLPLLDRHVFRSGAGTPGKVLQMPSFFHYESRLGQGRNSRQSSEVAESLFGRPDLFGPAPILGMETL